MPPLFWVAVGLGIFCAWPFAIDELRLDLQIVLTSVSAATVLLAWRRVSGRLGYFEGMRIVAAAVASPFDAVTALYIAPVLMLAHLAALCLAVGMRARDARRGWWSLIRAVYMWRYGPQATEFEEMLRELRWPPEVLLGLPRTKRRWFERYLLLYSPKDASTFLHHVGFYLGIGSLIAMVWLLTAPELPPDIEGNPEILWALAFWVLIGAYCYRVARVRDPQQT